MKKYYYDDFDDLDYDWYDEEVELYEQLLMENPLNEIFNDMNYKTFKNMKENDKFTYLYNKIRDLYSYLSSKKDVEDKKGDLI